jgi:2-C-methyl-D-erythritol 4-phosphate cytidylyltransferase
MTAGATGRGRGPVWAIVLAAGSGVRFGERKQFVSAAGRRLVDLAVERAVETCDQVVLVLPPGERWTGPVVDHVAEGGEDRGGSVRSGLATIPDQHGTVVVHQAANPLVRASTFHALIAAVAQGAPAAFPGLRPADIVRTVDGTSAGDVLGRDELVLVQTPAAFRLEVLRMAHGAGGGALEDTALVSAAGFAVHVVPGDPRNVHVATPEDLEVVEALLLAEQG